MTTREEAVATVREAVEGGVTLLDLAPRYGDGEAERVIGEAFGGRLPAGVRVTTKYRVSNPPAGEVFGRLERSLDESLERMRLPFADVLFLHGYLVADEAEGGERRTPAALFRDAVRPALERLAGQGRIGAWGITARKRGTGVMGIRVAAAGALTDAIDRELPDDSPIMADFRRAGPLRELARELGETAASLAHRYALSMPGVDTVVLGIKNRSELRECLVAESRGPLPAETMERIDNDISGAMSRGRRPPAP